MSQRAGENHYPLHDPMFFRRSALERAGLLREDMKSDRISLKWPAGARVLKELKLAEN